MLVAVPVMDSYSSIHLVRGVERVAGSGLQRLLALRCIVRSLLTAVKSQHVGTETYAYERPARMRGSAGVGYGINLLVALFV